jgi:pimeloyl-ACP methyl ester carboxylesterase
MDEAEVTGLRIAYERAGSGPPIVLLNGYVGDGRATWRRQLEDLADEFTVVAWDAPGSGRSADPPSPFRLTDYADCLAGFIDALGLGRPHVAGLSFGGGLALELVHRRPDVPRSLVLAGAYAGWAGSLPPEIVEQRLRQAFALADQTPEQLVAELLPTMFSGSADPSLVEAFARSLAEFHPDGIRVMATAMADADLRDTLARIEVPTLVVHGELDVRAPRVVADALHAAIPRSRLVVLSGAGHVTCLEAADRFNEEVRRFLRTCGSEPTG